MPSNLEHRLAELIVNFGANIQPGQIVDIGSGLGKEELTRAITASAYKRGAKFVDVSYWDPHLKRERVKYAPDEVLDYVPPWYGERTLKLGEQRGATISLSGPIAPHLFDDLDPERLGRDVFPRVKEWATVINERTVNWCVAPGPSMKWAQLVHPDLDPEAALEKLWEQVVHICRLDEDDPVAAWRERSKVLKGVASRLGERHFDAIHLEGPGTDLTVGLLPTSRWNGGGDETVDDRKSTRLNSSHPSISYAVFCLKKKKIEQLALRGVKAVEFPYWDAGAPLFEQVCEPTFLFFEETGVPLCAHLLPTGRSPD